MATIVKMPKTGLNMTEGDINRFLVKEGDTVSENQPLVEIETDKNTTEIISPTDGIVLKILCGEGDTLPILMPVMVIGRKGEDFNLDLPGEPKTVDVTAAEDDSSVPTESGRKAAPERIMATPLARRMAREMEIDLKEVEGSGPSGAIMRRDIIAFREKRPERAEISFVPPVQRQPVPWSLPVRQRIPVKGMRKTIAQNMSMSKSLIPHFSLTTCVDMTEAMALRKQVMELTGVKVSYNDILTKAICSVMPDNAMVNSSMGNGEILQFSTVNVGIAVGLDNGLVVPVIREAETKSLGQIAETSAKLIRDAREGSLAPDSRVGGTITISNLGMYDIESFAAIINAPESCILAAGKIEEKAVVRNGEIVIRPMMNITASFDHRIIDGTVGAKFLTQLKQTIENPLLMLV